ncbi:MAG: hypothetical protein WCD70_14215, partial [Alphaproteobacteria bacterium]
MMKNLCLPLAQALLKAFQKERAKLMVIHQLMGEAGKGGEGRQGVFDVLAVLKLLLGEYKIMPGIIGGLQPLREGAGFTGWKGHANANLCHNFLKTRMLSFAVRRQ